MASLAANQPASWVACCCTCWSPKACSTCTIAAAVSSALAVALLCIRLAAATFPGSCHRRCLPPLLVMLVMLVMLLPRCRWHRPLDTLPTLACLHACKNPAYRVVEYVGGIKCGAPQSAEADRHCQPAHLCTQAPPKPLFWMWVA